LGIPGGLLAVAAGTLLAWLLPADWTGSAMSGAGVREAWSQVGPALPVWSGGELLAVVRSSPELWVRFVSVIIPMGLINVIGSLQNIESAEAGGDRYDTRSSLAANGVGTILAALFGSCFPTTIYIGHPGWKGLGARAGYSVLNGLAIVLICLSGAVALVDRVVPIEAGMPIVLWIGIVITAQAFQATRREHAPAVAVGLFPAIAAWGATVMFGAFDKAGGLTVQALLADGHEANAGGFLIHGLIVLERGYIFTCMVLAAVSAHLIDRRFFSSAWWALAGALCTVAGLSHAYQLSGNLVDYLLVFASGAEGVTVYRAHAIATGYLLMAVLFVVVGLCTRERGAPHRPTLHL
jgi:AGZA family xanthine/uracil permease-like MFS transporter